MSSVVDDTRHFAAGEYFSYLPPPGYDDARREGYIIAFASSPSRPGPYRLWTVFAQFVTESGALAGCDLSRAFIFPTYQHASKAATGWSHTNTSTTRIIKVKTQPVFEVFKDYPINLIDVLAEL